jgi:hypothetical protein
MKNQDLLLFLLLAIFGFLIWNRTTGENFTDVSADKPVEPATIQTIINAIQAKVPDLYPIQTVYINPFEGDQGSMIYNARIMFLNTRGYFGVQYDVKADSRGNVLEMTEQPSPAMTGPFMAYAGDGYEKFEDIQTVLDQQFAELKTQVPGYETKLDTFLETQSAYNRARATQAARAPYEKIAATTGGSGYLGSGALAYSE